MCTAPEVLPASAIVPVAVPDKPILKSADGVEEPIPSLPFADIVISLVAVEEAILNISADPAVPTISSFAIGAAIPIPVFPLVRTVNGKPGDPVPAVLVAVNKINAVVCGVEEATT